MTVARLLERNAAVTDRRYKRLDLILVTRGGGSLEDLWAFNEEAVARAIFESAVPVVSAVGHEIDFTISDFVADVRAATPSVAAEIITEGVFASRQLVADLTQRMARAHPRRRMNELLQRLDDLQAGLLRCTKQGVREQHVAWQNLATRLLRVRPAQLLRQRRESLMMSQRRLRELAQGHLRNWRNRFGATESRLRLLGPEQVLSRGYSITMDAATGRVLRKANEVKAGQKLKTRLKTGEILSRLRSKAGKDGKLSLTCFKWFGSDSDRRLFPQLYRHFNRHRRVFADDLPTCFVAPFTGDTAAIQYWQPAMGEGLGESLTELGKINKFQMLEINQIGDLKNEINMGEEGWIDQAQKVDKGGFAAADSCSRPR